MYQTSICDLRIEQNYFSRLTPLAAPRSLLRSQRATVYYLRMTSDTSELTQKLCCRCLSSSMAKVMILLLYLDLFFFFYFSYWPIEHWAIHLRKSKRQETDSGLPQYGFALKDILLGESESNFHYQPMSRKRQEHKSIYASHLRRMGVQFVNFE